MERRFSEMTPFELTQKIGEFTDQARKAEQLGMVSELAVYERKIDMAKAYLMDPESFKAGQTYFIRDRAFRIHHMKGTFAWGTLEGGEELRAFPISLLKKKKWSSGRISDSVE
ncbi:DUF1811 family protein [Sporolactobacillus shoreae]|uniref:DUF1811 family protein n=1 Tax=Sporolactobacillus shoreae TaxID=1465501 RepID=A0A4Z0GKG1_9BACL|nr:YfhH family protein [Sporolactobacillus shoreae]TGA96464.1 DUF1811 family protein [Sporolactobacillus shoreae]